jgi:hypothetical protein
VAGVPAILLDRLAAARRAGQAFEEAWDPALAAAVQAADTGRDRREWLEAFRGTLESWRGAFERRSAPRCERALRVVAEDPERVPVPERECEHCHGPIPAGRGRPFAPAKFCADECRRAATRERERLARAAA